MSFSFFLVMIYGSVTSHESHFRLPKSDASILEEVLTKIKAVIGVTTADRISFSKESLKDDLESAFAYYKASVYARLACERPDAYSSQQAFVSTTPFEDEQIFLTARKAQTASALNSLLGTALTTKTVPTIGFCGSGGGVRAQYGTLGWLRTAERLGLLSTLQYVSGLSGSTWGLMPWVASQLSVKDYLEQCIPRLSKTIEEHLSDLTSEDRIGLLCMLARSYYNKRSLSPVDLYGWFLGHIFLKNLPGVDNSAEYPLSSLRPQIESGAFPLVIGTSVIGSNTLIKAAYGHCPTFEMTPWYSGSFELQTFIPQWSLGRPFEQGASQSVTPETLFPEITLANDEAKNLAPEFAETLDALATLIEYLMFHTYYGQELPLCYLMGIYGSVFSVDLYNLLVELSSYVSRPSPEKEKLYALLLATFQDALEQELGKLVTLLSEGYIAQGEVVHALQNDHLAAAIVANPCFELSGHALSTLKDTTLVDAGLDLIDLERCNLGIIPLLNRQVDCIIICDNSADIVDAPSLRAAEKIAKKAALAFPRIDYDALAHQEVSLIVDDENPLAPLIVYIPVVANVHYSKKIGHHFDPVGPHYQAYEFTYTAQQAEDLMGLVDYLVTNNWPLFITALEKAVARKSQLLSHTHS